MSGRYKPSAVDESLFGTGRNGTNTKRRSTGSLPSLSTSTVITSGDLERIKRASIILTPAEERRNQAEAFAQKEARERKSKLRKERMKELEKKAEQMAQKSDIEVSNIARADALRKMASEKLDENSDMVKLLTSLAARASAFTIRDAQLVEKEERERVEAEYDRRMDIKMEIDRLSELKRREQQEADKRSKRIEDRKVITEQMQYRQRMKILAAEQREQENVQMRKLAQKYADDDAEAARKRAIEIENSRLEVLKANEESLRRKVAARDLEKKEVQDILIYQQLKDAEMLKREQEEAAQALEKKERQAKLLAQQEKAQNNQGKLDEIRARRALEERERRARKEEKDKRIKRKADQAELTAARQKQAADHHMRDENEKALLAMEYADALEYSRVQSEREEREAREKAERTEHHRVELMKQIADREFDRKKNTIDKYATGANHKQELIKEEARLSVLREKLIADMEHKGVNPKYLGEMKGVDIRKMLNR